MSDLACLPYSVGTADEGVCLLMQIGPYRLMLDCGMRDISPLLASGGRPADFVFCSHAHSDHAAGLLALRSAFPELPIYASEVTAQLLPLAWRDRTPTPTASWFQGIPWRQAIALAEGLTIELFPAGHLPGAALALIVYRAPNGRTYRVVYTGDFFLSGERLVDGLPLAEVRSLQPDVLILEGGYGTARHPRRRNQENQLAERIRHLLGAGRSVLMPLPMLGLGQELLMLLRSHHYFTGRDFTIWVDEAIAAGCDAYLAIVDELPSSVQNFARHQNLFWDERVLPRVRRLHSKRDGRPGDRPCLVLADYTKPLDRYFDRGEWSILLSDTGPESLNDRAFEVAVRCGTPLEFYMLSEHCDVLGTLQLVHNLRPQHAILVHGAREDLADLAGIEELNSRYQLHCPKDGSRLELPIGEVFIQPAAPVDRYEGDLVKTADGVTLHLPEDIIHNSRWQALAETGAIEVRWQGNELAIRGLSQKELIEREGRQWVPPGLNCCQTCRYYRKRHCRNPESPLAQRQVDPTGCCPLFQVKPGG